MSKRCQVSVSIDLDDTVVSDEYGNSNDKSSIEMNRSSYSLEISFFQFE